MKHNGTLIATHSSEISRSQLSNIEAPPKTKTWHPVKHFDLLMTLHEALKKRDIEVSSEQLAISRGGALFYGVLDLNKQGSPDFKSSLGVRSSNNRLLAIKIAVGGRVVVCDNLMFSGDMIALKRKHTSGLNLRVEVDNAIKVFSSKFESFCTEIQRMKFKKIDDNVAKTLVFDVFAVQKIYPTRFLKVVAKEYLTPSFTEFEPRTLWSLYNAFTYAAKGMSPERKFSALQQVGKFFNTISTLSI